jgi:DNA-binding NtrC family response regulator
MRATEQKCILIVDSNRASCERLAQEFRAADYDVVTADTGERAFLILRDWHYQVGWLYTRASLPGLIDGWILADQYHDAHPTRAAVISAHKARSSARGDIILNEPTLTSVAQAIWHAIGTASGEQRCDA